MKKEMMTIKSFLASKEISKEKFDEMDAEKSAAIYNELNENNVAAFKELQDNGATAKELAEAVAKMNEEKNSQIQKIALAVEKQGIAIAKGLKANEAVVSVTLKTQIVEHREAIKSLAARKGAIDEIALKADFTTGSIAPNSNSQLDPNIGQLDVRTLNLYNLFGKIQLTGNNHNGTFRYFDWDEDTSNRAAAMVAEGALFPESTAKFKQYTIDIKKIGDSMPVTEEALEDEGMFTSQLERFLRINVDILIDVELLLGDGTGNNITGLATYSTAYVAATSGITDASIYDLIVDVKRDISATTGNKYRVNFALMNLVDINQMKLKKDANNNYIMPPFVSRDGGVVDGITVIENNGVVANTMYMGDRNFADILEIGGLTLATGEVANQFLEDTKTLKVRKRMQFLIRNSDLSGFRKITDIAAALVTLAT